jgi:predicted Zn finger-like uncharacterized protein
MLRLTCPSCKTAMRIPAARLPTEGAAGVRCANPACRRVLTLKRQAAPTTPPLETADAAGEE